MVPEQVGRLQVFVRDRVVRAHQTERRLVLAVCSRALYPLMCASEQVDRLPAPVTALLAAADPALCTREVHLCDSDDARMDDLAAVGERRRASARVAKRSRPRSMPACLHVSGTGLPHTSAHERAT